jgi:hypothetical protein
MQTVIRTSRRFLHEAAQNFEPVSNIQDKKLKIQNLQGKIEITFTGEHCANIIYDAKYRNLL